MGPPLYTTSSLAQRRAELVRRRRRRRRALGAAIVVVVLALGITIGALSAGSGGTRGGSTRATAAAIDRLRAPGAASNQVSGRVAAAMRTGNARIRQLAQLGLPIYCAGRHGNAVAFTFDDGPGPYTYLAIRKLKQADERATFFVVGRSMDAFPGWLPRELQVAAIGDHTYTHPVLPELPPSSVEDELGRTKEKIEAASGEHADLFRPPYGEHDAMVDQTAKRLGLLEIMWTVDSRDSEGANYAGIIQNVEAGLKPGAIILMHENRGQTIRALTTLLPVLHRRHLRSVSLPELFASDPPSAAQVRKGRAGCGLTGLTPAGAGG